MVAAVYTSDLTTLVPNDVAATSNWAATGGGASGLNIETDYFIQGNNCCSKNAWAGDTKGMVEDTTNTALSTGSLDAVYMWVTHLTPGSLDLKANGGISIKMGTSSTALNDYYYAGSDTIDYGAPWLCAIIDPENTTATVGTIAGNVMDTYGAEATLVGGPTKGAPFGIDAIRQGRSYEITEGDSGVPATFTAAATENDLNANRFGQFQAVSGISGSYTMQCLLSIGTAATAAYFDDSNSNITITDLEFVDAGFQLIEIVNAGTTVLWENINISAVGTNTRGNFLVTSSTSVDLTTCTFTDLGTFVLDANTTLIGCTFRRTQLITQNTSTITDCTIDSNVATTALSVNDLDLVTGCTFISDGTGHAIDLGTIAATDTIGWDNSDSGYAATDGSTGNETILVSVDSGQTLTINVATGATTPTIYNTGLGTVSVVAGQVTLTITVQDQSDQSLLENARVYVTAAAGGSLSVGTVIIDKDLTNVSGVASDTRSYSTDQPITGKVRLSTSPDFYKTGPISGTISSATGLSLTVQLIQDA